MGSPIELHVEHYFPGHNYGRCIFEAISLPDVCEECNQRQTREHLGNTYIARTHSSEKLRAFVDKKLNIDDRVNFSYRKREVVASHTTTVGELKLLIFQEMDIMPYKQDLWQGKLHLDDDNVCLASSVAHP